MNKSFEEILSKILEAKEKASNRKIEDIVTSVYKEIGASKEKEGEFRESCLAIDEINETCNEIKQAKKEGLTKEDWIMDTMDELTEGMSKEDADNLAEGIIGGVENAIHKSTKANKAEATKQTEATNTTNSIKNGESNTINNIG